MAQLYYFNGRGRAEIVRMTLAAAGVPFTEVFVSDRETYLQLCKDGKLLFDQLPLLEIDGKNIVQSHAIVRYIAGKHHLRGKNLDEEVLIDQYYEGARDLMTPTYPLGFMPEKDVLEGPVKTAMKKYFPIFDKIAGKTGTGYLVGNSLTVADVSLLEPMLVCTEYLGKDILKDYPSLTKFFNTVTSNDKIAAYLKGPQRKRKNDERYVTEVKTTLAWS